VIEPRCEEVLALVRSEIERAGMAGHLTSGIVLTGGGAVLGGMTELAERVFRAPARLGLPLHLSGLVDVVASPMYSTAVGLVLHGLKRHGRTTAQEDWSGLGPLGRARHRVVSWLREFF
jgi:cell division protein FtsA